MRELETRRRAIMRRTGKKAAALAVTAALAVSAAGCGSVKDSDVVVTIGAVSYTHLTLPTTSRV